MGKPDKELKLPSDKLPDLPTTPLPLVLTDLAFRGQAVGRWKGKAVFVAGGLPGEVVQVEITGDHKSFATARLLRVIQAAPDRVDPPCIYFGRCGGCQWQHLAYPIQAIQKQHILQQLLERLGNLPHAPVVSTRAMTVPWHYRNTAQFAINPAGDIGYQYTGSHTVLDIASCPLLQPELNTLHQKLRLVLQESSSSEVRGRLFSGYDLRTSGFPVGTAQVVTLYVRAGQWEAARTLLSQLQARLPSGVALNVETEPTRSSEAGKSRPRHHFSYGETHLDAAVPGRTPLFRLSPASFFQVNYQQAAVLLDLVVELLAPQPTDVILDGYSGAGFFSIFLAPLARRVYAVESYPGTVADARMNQSHNRIENLILVEARLEDELELWQYPGGKDQRSSPEPRQASSAKERMDGPPDQLDGVVLDPPRSGCHPKVLASLCHLRPGRIVYVSCDPSTLARDLKILVHEGRYRLETVVPVDMFPQTYHIESVSLLRQHP